jgi:hypothetical protein
MILSGMEPTGDTDQREVHSISMHRLVQFFGFTGAQYLYKKWQQQASAPYTVTQHEGSDSQDIQLSTTTTSTPLYRLLQSVSGLPEDEIYDEARNTLCKEICEKGMSKALDLMKTFSYQPIFKLNVSFPILGVTDSYYFPYQDPLCIARIPYDAVDAVTFARILRDKKYKPKASAQQYFYPSLVTRSGHISTEYDSILYNMKNNIFFYSAFGRVGLHQPGVRKDFLTDPCGNNISLAMSETHLAYVHKDVNVCLFPVVNTIPRFDNNILLHDAHTNSIAAIALDDKDLYTGDTRGSIKRWNLETMAHGREVHSKQDFLIPARQERRISCLLPMRPYLWVGCKNGRVLLFDLRMPNEIMLESKGELHNGNRIRHMFFAEEDTMYSATANTFVIWRPKVKPELAVEEALFIKSVVELNT